MATFTALDPDEGNWQEPMTLNNYGYVGGNPISRTDPTGMRFGNAPLLTNPIDGGGRDNNINEIQPPSRPTPRPAPAQPVPPHVIDNAPSVINNIVSRPPATRPSPAQPVPPHAFESIMRRPKPPSSPINRRPITDRDIEILCPIDGGILNNVGSSCSTGGSAFVGIQMLIRQGRYELARQLLENLINFLTDAQIEELTEELEEAEEETEPFIVRHYTSCDSLNIFRGNNYTFTRVTGFFGSGYGNEGAQGIFFTDTLPFREIEGRLYHPLGIMIGLGIDSSRADCYLDVDRSRLTEYPWVDRLSPTGSGKPEYIYVTGPSGATIGHAVVRSGTIGSLDSINGETNE